MSISIGFGAIRSCNVSRSPKSPKKIHKTPYFGVQDHSRSLTDLTERSERDPGLSSYYNANRGANSLPFLPFSSLYFSLSSVFLPLAFLALNVRPFKSS